MKSPDEFDPLVFCLLWVYWGGFLREVKHKWMVSVLPPAAVYVIVHGSSINTLCQCKVVWGQINPFC